jgi:hypothetical protein
MCKIPRSLRLAVIVPLLTACAATGPASPASQASVASPSHEKFEPAPMPFVRYQPPGSTVGALEIPIPPKMPPGTGAVPVSNSPFRGAIVTGIRESF